MRSTDTIERWRPAIIAERERLGVTAAELPVEVVLSLIRVESNGDPKARRAGSQFWGLLQMGRAAGLDVGIDDTSVLHGDGVGAIRAFIRYQGRYAGRTGWRPDWVALCWKAGPGTCKRIGQMGGDFDEAVAQVAATTPALKETPEYLRRFRAGMGLYS